MSSKTSVHKLVQFLVRGYKLTPKQGAEITHFVDASKLKLRNELKNKEFIGYALESSDSKKPNVTAYVNGLGTVNRVVVDESISKLSKNRINSFVVAAVSKALRQPKEFVHNSLKGINGEAISQLYAALEAYNPKEDTFTEIYNPALRQAFLTEQLYVNALYQQVLEEATKPEGHMHEDEELFYTEKKKGQLSDREMDAIMLSDKTPDSSLLK